MANLFNSACIIGNAVLRGKIPSKEVTPCIGGYFCSTEYIESQRSLVHTVCYNKIPSYGVDSGHSASEISKVESLFSDEELAPFIKSGTRGYSNVELKSEEQH